MTKIKVKGWEITKNVIPEDAVMPSSRYDIYDDKMDILIHVDKIEINKSDDFEWLYLYNQHKLVLSIWINNKEDVNKIYNLIHGDK